MYQKYRDFKCKDVPQIITIKYNIDMLNIPQISTLKYMCTYTRSDLAEGVLVSHACPGSRPTSCG